MKKIGFDSTGALKVLEDDEAIKIVILGLLGTQKGERVFSDVGSNLYSYLFENIDELEEQNIKNEIIDILEENDVPIEVSNINITKQDTKIIIDIEYDYLGIQDKVSLEVGE